MKLYQMYGDLVSELSYALAGYDDYNEKLDDLEAKLELAEKKLAECGPNLKDVVVELNERLAMTTRALNKALEREKKAYELGGQAAISGIHGGSPSGVGEDQHAAEEDSGELCRYCKSHDG